ncbi:MAG: DUF1549 domain-containing protein, partial [Verrucomicrobiota bacterium]
MFLLVTVQPALLSAADRVDFARDIRPILNAKCTGCHGGVKQAGGVSFVYENQVINFEGDTGNPVVVPNDVDASELFFRITLPASDVDRMPPADEHPKGLSEDEIALVKQWIDEGATWSGHWSFETPEETSVSGAEARDAELTPIDQFVRVRLKEEGIQPSPAAEPARLLRRLSLDITGLPPSIDEIDAFIDSYAKDPDAAITSAVDAQLASPAFGEKWSSMWLDLVRYADSRGLGQDGKRTIWPYRDWVINAFNDDMPFDQFTIRQLAGDLLPNPTIDDLIATAAHRNTQTNNEGGTDDEEFRTEAVIDRINTTWQTWGSITFGCVQCHDHPYEAFHHDDYYKFMAFFNNTADTDLKNDEPLLQVPNNPANRDHAHSLDLRMREIQTNIWKLGSQAVASTQWKPLPLKRVGTSNNTIIETEDKEGQHHFFTKGTVQRGPIYQLYPSLPEEPLTAFRLTVLPTNPEKAFRDSEWGFQLSEVDFELVDKNEKVTPIRFSASVADVPSLPHSPETLIGANGKGFQAWSR